jgi:hypothetical protein
MNRIVGHSLIFLLAVPAFAGVPVRADDLKVNQLEQEVRELKRLVLEQGRRIEQLERANAAAHAEPGNPPNHLQPQRAEAPWLDAQNWKRIEVGSSEDDVRKFLGAPTTQRDLPLTAEQQLFYARELGVDRFLSGYVKVKDHHVTEIQAPVLR